MRWKLLILLLLLPLEAWSKGAKCTDYFKLLEPLSPSRPKVKLQIKKDVSTEEAFACLKKGFPGLKAPKNANFPKILKKGMVLKLPAPIMMKSHLSLRYRYAFGSFDSTVYSRSLDLSSHYLEALYLAAIGSRSYAVFTLGLKRMTTEITETGGTDDPDADLSPVGGLSYNHRFTHAWTGFTFYDLDRYVVVGGEATGNAEYSTLFKHTLGAGVRLALIGGLAGILDLAYIGPSKSDVNAIKSGTQIGVGLQYSWKEWGLGYRYEKTKIKTEDYTDDGGMHSANLVVNF